MCAVRFFAVSASLGRGNNHEVLCTTRTGGDFSAFCESILSLGGFFYGGELRSPRPFYAPRPGASLHRALRHTAYNAVQPLESCVRRGDFKGTASPY